MSAETENKYGIGNTGGRPPLYEEPEVMAAAIDEYFVYIKGEEKEIPIKSTDKKGKETTKFITEIVRYPEPATVTGLILYLGFSHREALSDYEKREGFSDIVRRARMRVEHSYECKLSSNLPTGSIFALKNMGWKDKTEVESNVTTKTDAIDLTKYTDDELRTIAELQRKGRVSEA